MTVPILVPETPARVPGNFFIDARMDSLTNVALAALNPPASTAGRYAAPGPGSDANDAGFPLYTVPSETSALHVVANATLPIEFDFAGP